MDMSYLDDFVQTRIESMHKLLQKNNRKSLILGVSGGLDSSIVLCLLKRMADIYPEAGYNIVAVSATIDGSNGTTGQEDARINARYLCDQLQVSLICYGLKRLSREAVDCLVIEDQYVRQQIDYWLRPMTFYKFAMTNENSIMISTVNYAEWSLGWFSQYLDVFGIHPIVDCHKSFLYQLAEYFQIPRRIIDAAPSGGLANGRTDEQELGFTYNDFEKYSDEELPEDHVSFQKIKDRIESTEFKRFRFNQRFIFQLPGYE